MTASRLLVSTAALAMALGGAALAVAPVSAQTLEQAMAAAYRTNPVLGSRRAQQRATDEQVPLALSNWRPQVTVTGNIGGANDTVSQPSSAAGGRIVDDNLTRNPRQAQLQVTQPLYRGGRTVAETSRAENNVQAGRAQLIATEQNVLFDVVQFYANTLRDQALVDLNTNQVQVLQRQFEAARSRFQVGEITRTDVAQAEARLARARADLVQAEGNLAVTRAQYLRVVGEEATRLSPVRLPRNLPRNQREAVDIAADNNPNVIAARFVEASAVDDIRLVLGELLPTVSLQGTLSHVFEQQNLRTTRDSAQILAILSMPLYTSGSVEARVRAARQTLSQRRIDVETARRQAREDAARAFQSLTAARNRVRALATQIRASEIALEGVEQEARVGSRTTLDVLDAEQELLSAKTNLVQSQRDDIFATYQLVQAMGRLTAEQLNLPVERYDPTSYYSQARGRWYGLTIPEPATPARR